MLCGVSADVDHGEDWVLLRVGINGVLYTSTDSEEFICIHAGLELREGCHLVRCDSSSDIQCLHGNPGIEHLLPIDSLQHPAQR